MSKVLIELNTDNDAFADNYNLEVARILRDLADRFDDGEDPSLLKDLNGNTVGTVVVDSSEDLSHDSSTTVFSTIVNRLSATSDRPWGKLKCPCGNSVCNDFMLTHTHSEGRMSEADADFIINSRKDILTLLFLCYTHREDLDRMLLHTQVQDFIGGDLLPISQSNGIKTQGNLPFQSDSHLGQKRSHTNTRGSDSTAFLGVMNSLIIKTGTDGVVRS